MKSIGLKILPEVPPHLVPEMDRELAMRARYTSLSLGVVTLLAAHITGLTERQALPVALVIGAVFLLSALRLVLAVRFENLYERSARGWVAAKSFATLAPAMLIGLAQSALIAGEGAGWNTIVCLSSTTALTAGASISLTSRLPLFYGYVTLTLMPPVIALALQKGQHASWLAVLMVVYMIQVLVFGRFNHTILMGKVRNQHLLQKRAAELEEANAEVRAANAAKDEFLASMGQELKTPLNGILGLTDLLLETSLKQRQADYLQDLRASGQNLLKTISSVLDYSRVEKGEWEIHNTMFSLPALLRTVLASQDELARRHGNQLNLELDPTLPVQMVGDAPTIGQIISRLLENAARFTTAGQITLRARVHHRADGLAAIGIEVQDDGPGIPPEQQESIFQAFRQDRDQSHRRGGTGLGLAMARRLAERLGGRITLESIPGQGSTFCLLLTLPEARVHTPEVPAPDTTSTRTPAPDTDLPRCPDGRPEEQCLKGLRVLLVEDNTVNAKLTTRILEKGHVKVTWAVNGKEAVNLFLQGEFDIVLMDIQMPVMDGFSATSAIREAERDTGGRVPVIALTAHAMPGYREKCLIGGMDDYLTKPLHPRALRETLINWSPSNNVARQI